MIRIRLVHRMLGLGSWLHHKHVPAIPRLIVLAVWSPWICRVFGHTLVPKLPMCFRCEADWDSWDEVTPR